MKGQADTIGGGEADGRVGGEGLGDGGAGRRFFRFSSGRCRLVR
jgi:hypothetical protein